MSNFQKIQSCIKETEIPTDTQNSFLVLITRVDDAELQPLADLCDAEPESLPDIVDLYIAKFDAMQKGDMGAWNEIMDRQSKLLA